jgi:hypothetical protein
MVIWLSAFAPLRESGKAVYRFSVFALKQEGGKAAFRSRGQAGKRLPASPLMWQGGNTPRR